MFSCSDKTSKTKRLTDDLTAGLVASHSLSGNMSRHRLCSQSTSLPSSRPSSNILKKLPCFLGVSSSFFTNGNQCQFELLFCLLWMVATQPISTRSPPWCSCWELNVSSTKVWTLVVTFMSSCGIILNMNQFLLALVFIMDYYIHGTRGHFFKFFRFFKF